MAAAQGREWPPVPIDSDTEALIPYRGCVMDSPMIAISGLNTVI